ncbi:hypothetical protein WN51_03262 [Melipona quadrifasciata]|uniref:Uncharacterized protein n=1 Tax=Melipona quadrifasciata TaxID=166423 RepID=A0A0M8ZW06_9HYME|nr:hypothetical protein WN51_03262 [Melipona quadrifasciata]
MQDNFTEDCLDLSRSLHEIRGDLIRTNDRGTKREWQRDVVDETKPKGWKRPRLVAFLGKRVKSKSDVFVQECTTTSFLRQRSPKIEQTRNRVGQQIMTDQREFEKLLESPWPCSSVCHLPHVDKPVIYPASNDALRLSTSSIKTMVRSDCRAGHRDRRRPGSVHQQVQHDKPDVPGQIRSGATVLGRLESRSRKHPAAMHHGSGGRVAATSLTLVLLLFMII